MFQYTVSSNLFFNVFFKALSKVFERGSVMKFPRMMEADVVEPMKIQSETGGP